MYSAVTVQTERLVFPKKEAIYVSHLLCSTVYCIVYKTIYSLVYKIAHGKVNNTCKV